MLLAFAQDSVPDPGRVSGTVLAENGRGLAFAQVTLTRLDPALGPLSYSTMRSTISDGSGQFSFAGVPLAVWLVDCHGGESLLPAPLRVRLTADAPSVSGITLHLAPAGVIHGRVVDAERGPLEGVRVAVGDDGLQSRNLAPVPVIDYHSGQLLHLQESARYPRLPLEVTYTDADGRFRLTPVVPGEATSLRLSGLPPFLDRTVQGITPGEFLTIELDRGATILGSILDSAGAPIGGARVRLHMVDVSPHGSWLVLQRESPRFRGAVEPTFLTVGDDGDYRIEGLLPGTYMLLVESKDRARALSPVLAITRADEVVRQDIQLEPELRIEGRLVVPALLSERVGSARLDLVHDGRSASSFLKTTPIQVAADGSFQIDKLSRGLVTLNVSVPGVSDFRLVDVPAGTLDLIIEVPADRVATTPLKTWPLAVRRRR